MSNFVDLRVGKFPSQSPFYSQYKQKMRAIAAQFVNQSDVWIEVNVLCFYDCINSVDVLIWNMSMN